MITRSPGQGQSSGLGRAGWGHACRPGASRREAWGVRALGWGRWSALQAPPQALQPRDLHGVTGPSGRAHSSGQTPPRLPHCRRAAGQGRGPRSPSAEPRPCAPALRPRPPRLPGAGSPARPAWGESRPCSPLAPGDGTHAQAGVLQAAAAAVVVHGKGLCRRRPAGEAQSGPSLRAGTRARAAPGSAGGGGPRGRLLPRAPPGVVACRLGPARGSARRTQDGSCVSRSPAPHPPPHPRAGGSAWLGAMDGGRGQGGRGLLSRR